MIKMWFYLNMLVKRDCYINVILQFVESLQWYLSYIHSLVISFNLSFKDYFLNIFTSILFMTICIFIWLVVIFIFNYKVDVLFANLILISLSRPNSPTFFYNDYFRLYYVWYLCLIIRMTHYFAHLIWIALSRPNDSNIFFFISI